MGPWAMGPGEARGPMAPWPMGPGASQKYRGSLQFPKHPRGRSQLGVTSFQFSETLGGPMAYGPWAHGPMGPWLPGVASGFPYLYVNPAGEHESLLKWVSDR